MSFRAERSNEKEEGDGRARIYYFKLRVDDTNVWGKEQSYDPVECAGSVSEHHQVSDQANAHLQMGWEEKGSMGVEDIARNGFGRGRKNGRFEVEKVERRVPLDQGIPKVCPELRKKKRKLR